MRRAAQDRPLAWHPLVRPEAQQRLDGSTTALAGRFRTGRVFYGSVLLVGGILYGFSFTYLRPLLHGDAFPALIHVHAALWFGWFGLFSIQAYLIGRTKLRWHGRLGIGVAAYTAALVSVSLILAVRTIGRDAHLVTGGIEAVSTIIPLSQILMFLMFFTWAVARRRHADEHKRLMILAALVGSTPAIARVSIGVLGAPSVPLIFAVSNLLLAGVVLADWAATRQLHRAYLWGGLFIIAVRTARIPIAMSPVWTWLVGQLSSPGIR